MSKVSERHHHCHPPHADFIMLERDTNSTHSHRWREQHPRSSTTTSKRQTRDHAFVGTNPPHTESPTFSKVLDEFSTKKKSFGRSMDFLNVFHGASTDAASIEAMTQEIRQSNAFDDGMREATVQVLLSRVDVKCVARCDKSYETSEELDAHMEECKFRAILCPFDGCGQYYSHCHEAQHHNGCYHMPIPCAQGCKMDIKRGDMTIHMNGPCLMKVVACPFKTSLGCTATPTQGDLEEHCTGVGAHRHLAMCIARMDIHAQETVNLCKEVKFEAGERAKLAVALGGSSMTTLSKDLDKAAKERKEMRNQIDNVTKECQRLQKENNTLKVQLKESGEFNNASMRELVLELEKKGVIDRDTRNRLGAKK